LSSRFFSEVNYASFHEDGASERRALELGPRDRVLCITGSGARALELLLDGPERVVAVDWNPAQSALLELKLAALRRLDYDEHLAFLGLTPCAERAAAYGRLRADLTPAARAFWDARGRAVAGGVYYAGRWERFLARLARGLRWTRRGRLARLLGAASVAEQSAIWREEWDDVWWRTYLRVASSRVLWRTVFREPGLEHVPDDVRMDLLLRERFDAASGRYLFRESPWALALFRGRLDPAGALPDHLAREHYGTLRERSGAIEVVTAALGEYLRADGERFDAFSLSDFSSYADEEAYGEAWRGVLGRSAPGARICERRFLVQYAVPEDVGAGISRDEALERELARADRSVVYTFLVARALRA